MFKCPYCGKEIKRLNNLKGHITAKHLRYGFYCPYCKEEFGTLQQLQNHLVSKDDKLHKNLFFLITKGYAKYIDKKLLITESDKQNQLQNAELHNINFYKCPFCDKIMPSFYSFKRHIRKNHYRNPFYCPYCKIEFNTLSAFYWHLRHKKDEFHQNLYILFKSRPRKFIKKELFMINNTETTKG